MIILEDAKASADRIYYHLPNMTNTAPALISQADIESLERSYTFREKPEVVQFIEKHPFLVPVLLAAPDQIRHYFPNEQLFLEVDSDPEIGNYVQLVLSILTTLDPYVAMDREDRLDAEWWRSLSHEERKHLCPILAYSDEF